DAATTALYTLSLHDALPISVEVQEVQIAEGEGVGALLDLHAVEDAAADKARALEGFVAGGADDEDGAFAGLQVRMQSCVGVFARSEEHTSELQSRENLVCRL